MNEMNFTEEDKAKVIEFLNMVAESATFTFKTKDVINYVKLLGHMQQKIVPKLDANLFELKRIVEPKSTEGEIQSV